MWAAYSLAGCRITTPLFLRSIKRDFPISTCRRELSRLVLGYDSLGLLPSVHEDRVGLTFTERRCIQNTGHQTILWTLSGAYKGLFQLSLRPKFFFDLSSAPWGARSNNSRRRNSSFARQSQPGPKPAFGVSVKCEPVGGSTVGQSAG